MKVLVIGGTGKIGSGVAKGMAKTGGVSKVILTYNTNVEGAKRVANEIGSKAEAVRLNCDDHASLLSLMRQADLVMNMVGPGSVYTVPMVKTALEARKNYIDINDDTEPLNELFALDEAAKKAGLTMISCTGVSPGLTNLWARYGVDKLDRVDEIKILWACNLNIAESSPANWGHRLDIYGGTVPIFDKGELTLVPGGSEPEEIDWPMPVGKTIHRICGHAEAQSIAHYIKKGLKRVVCKGAMTPREINELFVCLSNMGLESKQPIKVGDISISPFNFMRYFISSPPFKATSLYKDFIEKEKVIGANLEVRVEVKGLKDNKTTRVVCTLIGPERNAGTYISTYVIGQMILTGKINMKGVFCPEALGIDPQPILDELAKAGGISKVEVLQ